MNKLTKREIKRVRRGADLIADNTKNAIKYKGNSEGDVYACEAIGFGYLSVWLKDFYNPKVREIHDDQWVGLPYGDEPFTKRSQLQRELMLELFAHLKGIV
jgi:hypothetical protein